MKFMSLDFAFAWNRRSAIGISSIFTVIFSFRAGDIRRGDTGRRARNAAAGARPKTRHWIMSTKKKQKAHVRFSLNNEAVEVALPAHKTLLEVLREDLALTGTKHGCELGECGVCTVLVDGQPVLSCLLLGLDAEGREVTSIEGMAEGNEMHPLQDTFADLGAAQCGYCTPGVLLTAKELLEKTPSPSRAEIQEALSGILCRCTGYIKIYEAVELAAAHLRGEQVEPAKEIIYGYE